MKKVIFFRITSLVITGCLFCQGVMAQVIVTTAELQTLVGDWEGSLTYLDYTTKKPFTMPAQLRIGQLGNSNQFSFANAFPEEKNANWTDTVTLSANGGMLDGQTIIRKRTLPNGNLVIVTQKRGRDGNDNKPALIRHTLTIGKNSYVNRKEVQFAGTKKWIRRNEYSYKRPEKKVG